MSYELDTDEVLANALTAIRENIQKKPQYAELIAQQLLRAYPNHPEGLHYLGLLKHQAKDYQAAIEFFQQASAVSPDNPDIYNNVALSYACLQKFEEAVVNLSKAVDLKPSYVYINNLALQYRQLQRYEDCIELFRTALESQEAPPVWDNLGNVYGELKDLTRAERCFHRALELDPRYVPAHVDLAFTYFLEKNWARGFAEYEYRFDHFPQLDHYKRAYDQKKRWTGTDPTDKTFILYGEQGMGDSIQFARYAKFLKQRGAARVMVHAPDATVPIMERIEGIDKVFIGDISKDIELPEHDYHCSLMSLPHLLQQFEIDGKPYLKSVATLGFEDYKNTFNIGLVWAGSPAHPNDEARSIYLRTFKPLYETEGIKLFSLQLNYDKRCYTTTKKIIDFCEGCDNMRLVNMATMIQSFEDTATIISGLDLVICVDTALAHLAGAMGVPCWVLIPFNPDWRWGLEGETTEWYDSLRLFRQTTPGDWDSVIERVKHEVLLQIERSRLSKAEVAGHQ